MAKTFIDRENELYNTILKRRNNYKELQSKARHRKNKEEADDYGDRVSVLDEVLKDIIDILRI